MRSLLAYVLASVAVVMWTGTAAQERSHDATALKNPVKASPESVAAGKKIYDAQCAGCHGATGKGDGKAAAAITTGPKPSDLTDATWKHGDTDGEIYTLIHDGAKGTAMRGYNSRMKPDDIWNVVNYLRTLGPSPHKSR